MEKSIDIPELDAVQDLDTARFLLKHLVAAADGQATLRQHEGVAYIHCASGHGRSGTVCAALLIAEDPELSIDEAEKKLRQIRSGVGLSVGQKRTLQKLFGRD